MKHRTVLAEDFSISRIVHGHWRMSEWQLSNQEISNLVASCIEMGVTTIDTADIYGNYACEKIFGQALKLDKSLRNNIEIVTKCGIKLLSTLRPQQQIKYYDYSNGHIVKSAEQSLSNMGISHIDLLLLHRPAPFFNPDEVAKAFNHLKESGKVRYFGVSNFNPMQFEMLASHLDFPLVTNQVEISPFCLEHFSNGNMDFFLKNKIYPMAWSPLAGGRMYQKIQEKDQKISDALKKVGSHLSLDSLDQIAYAWLLNHPAQIIPVIGTGKKERIAAAVDSLKLKMETEHWYMIYNAATGQELP